MILTAQSVIDYSKLQLWDVENEKMIFEKEDFGDVCETCPRNDGNCSLSADGRWLIVAHDNIERWDLQLLGTLRSKDEWQKARVLIKGEDIWYVNKGPPPMISDDGNIVCHQTQYNPEVWDLSSPSNPVRIGYQAIPMKSGWEQPRRACILSGDASKLICVEGDNDSGTTQAIRVISVERMGHSMRGVAMHQGQVKAETGKQGSPFCAMGVAAGDATPVCLSLAYETITLDEFIDKTGSDPFMMSTVNYQVGIKVVDGFAPDLTTKSQWTTQTQSGCESVVISRDNKAVLVLQQWNQMIHGQANHKPIKPAESYLSLSLVDVATGKVKTTLKDFLDVEKYKANWGGLWGHGVANMCLSHNASHAAVVNTKEVVCFALKGSSQGSFTAKFLQGKNAAIAINGRGDRVAVLNYQGLALLAFDGKKVTQMALIDRDLEDMSFQNKVMFLEGSELLMTISTENGKDADMRVRDITTSDLKITKSLHFPDVKIVNAHLVGAHSQMLVLLDHHGSLSLYNPQSLTLSYKAHYIVRYFFDDHWRHQFCLNGLRDGSYELCFTGPTSSSDAAAKYGKEWKLRRFLLLPGAQGTATGTQGCATPEIPALLLVKDFQAQVSDETKKGESERAKRLEQYRLGVEAAEGKSRKKEEAEQKTVADKQKRIQEQQAREAEKARKHAELVEQVTKARQPGVGLKNLSVKEGEELKPGNHSFKIEWDLPENDPITEDGKRGRDYVCICEEGAEARTYICYENNQNGKHKGEATLSAWLYENKSYVGRYVSDDYVGPDGVQMIRASTNVFKTMSAAAIAAASLAESAAAGLEPVEIPPGLGGPIQERIYELYFRYYNKIYKPLGMAVPAGTLDSTMAAYKNMPDATLSMVYDSLKTSLV